MPARLVRRYAGPMEWKWHYSRWTGVMYGPVPVGIIVVVIVAAILVPALRGAASAGWSAD